MTSDELHELIATARGDRPADVLIRNAAVVNVFLGEIILTDMAVTQGVIAGFGTYPALETIDLQGRYVAPGFIDAHVHIESAMVGPTEFARTVLPHGTTAVVADPHEIANVLGTAGIEYMLAAGRNQPVSFFFTLPSCVPATHLESAGAELTHEDLAPLMGLAPVVGLAEMMNFPGTIQADGQIMAKLRLAALAGKRRDGHAPGLGGRLLNAYLTAGISSDHECTTAAEAREKLAGGMYIMVREGTGARNLEALLPAITPVTSRRMMWCTDDRHPHDLLDIGHIDSMVRQAVRAGLDPMTAIQMATLNPAQYFGLSQIGALAPGRRADWVVIDDLTDPVVRQVYVKGRLAAEAGRLSAGFSEQARFAPAALPGHMNIDPACIDLAVPARGRQIRVIEVIPDQIVTRSAVATARIENDRAVSDPARDILKIAVIERHKGTGRHSVGFIHGFGLQHGAMASTVAHDSHNVVALGVEDQDILLAIETLITMGGGLAAVDQGRVLAQLPLPVAGLMSDQPMAAVRRGLDDLTAAVRRLGCPLPDPFMTLSFMALPVIPELKITDQGLVDVGQFKIVPLFADDR